MKPYRAGIIGCGRIGSEFDEDPKRKYVSTHAGAYSKSNKTELIAVSDMDESKLEKCKRKWVISSAYKDYKAMLDRENIDILSICTPPVSHFEIVKEAVEHDIKAIFCEKPIAADIQQAREMISLCKEKNIILQVDHQRRFDPNILKTREYVSSGKLGAIQQASFYYTAGISNTGSHMFDLLLFLFGEAKWVIGSYSNNKSSKPEDPNIDGIVKFKNDITATFQACDVNKFLVFDLDIIGSKGRIKILKSGFVFEYYEASESDLFAGYKELFRTDMPFELTDSKDFLLFAVEHLADCIEKKQESISSGTDGEKSLELIIGAITSADNDSKKIHLSL